MVVGLPAETWMAAGLPGELQRLAVGFPAETRTVLIQIATRMALVLAGR
jgi:hypothetical protein